MNKEIKPLYRKVKPKDIGCKHMKGPDAKNERNTKKGIKFNKKLSDASN